MNIFEDSLQPLQSRNSTRNVKAAPTTTTITRKPLSAVPSNTHSTGVRQNVPVKKNAETTRASIQQKINAKKSTIVVIDKTSDKKSLLPQKRKIEEKSQSSTAPAALLPSSFVSNLNISELLNQSSEVANSTSAKSTEKQNLPKSKIQKLQNDFEFLNNSKFEANEKDDSSNEQMNNHQSTSKSLIEASIMHELASQNKLLKDESFHANEEKRIAAMDTKMLQSELDCLQQKYSANQLEFEKKKEMLMSKHQSLVDQYTKFHFSESDRIQNEFEQEKEIILNEISEMKKKIIKNSLRFKRLQKKNNNLICKLTLEIERAEKTNAEYEKTILLQSQIIKEGEDRSAEYESLSNELSRLEILLEEAKENLEYEKQQRSNDRILNKLKQEKQAEEMNNICKNYEEKLNDLQITHKKLLKKQKIEFQNQMNENKKLISESNDQLKTLTEKHDALMFYNDLLAQKIALQRGEYVEKLQGANAELFQEKSQREFENIQWKAKINSEVERLTKRFLEMQSGKLSSSFNQSFENSTTSNNVVPPSPFPQRK